MPHTRLAAELPAGRRSGGGKPLATCSHSLRLHGRTFPAQAVAAFLEGGPARGGRYFAACSPSHWERVRERLSDATAPCLFLDSRGIARRAAAGKTDALRGLLAKVEALVEASRGQSGASLRIFTDLGSRLRRAGLDHEALWAEEALEELCRRHQLAILCVYPVDDQDPRQRDYHEAMVLHDRVLTE